MTRTLCLNCDNSEVCLWKSDDVVLCNEYTLQPIKEENHSPPKQAEIRNKKLAQNLCSNCDKVDNCLYKHNTLNTIFCEEYQ